MQPCKCRKEYFPLARAVAVILCESCRGMEAALAEPFVRPQLKEDLDNG